MTPASPDADAALLPLMLWLRLVRVRLGGGAGNGIGAVVRLGHQGQWGPAREIHAGGGYWSQDSPVLVMSLGAQPPSEISVRWPGGRVTTGAVPSGAREIRAGADGQVEKLR